MCEQLSTDAIMRIRIESQQTMVKAFHNIQANDTCSNYEYNHSVRTYNTKDSVEHRKEQFAGLQKFYDNNLPLDTFNWHVKNILMKYIFEGELYYLVRYLNTNMNAAKHNYEYPLE